MAPIFADTFDDYNASFERWSQSFGTILYSSGYAPFSAPAGFTQQGMEPSSQASGKIQNLPANSARLIFGGWFNFSSLPTGNAGFLAFADSSFHNLQVSVTIGNSGQLKFWRGGNWQAGGFSTTLIGTYSKVIPAGWHFIEVDITFNSTAGAISLWVDQPQGATPVFSLSNVNTIGTANAYANELIIGDLTDSAPFWVFQCKDIYLLDNAGSAPTNAQLGMCRGFTKVASGPGGLTNWTANGAGSNYQCTNNEPPNDSIYVSAASSVEDTYTMSTVGLASVPFLVMGRLRAWIDDAGPHTIQHVARHGGTDALGTANSLSATPTFFDTFFPTDPSTSVAWTAAGADAAQSGQYRTT